MRTGTEANNIALYAAMLVRRIGIKMGIEALKKRFSRDSLQAFAQKFQGCKNSPIVAKIAASLGETALS